MNIIKLFSFLLIVLGFISCSSHQQHLEFKIIVDSNSAEHDLSILKNRIFELSGEQAEIIELPNSVFHFKLKSFQDSALIFQAIQTPGNFEICESFGLLEIYPTLVNLNNQLIGSNNLPQSLMADTSVFVKSNPLFSILMPNTTEQSSLAAGNPIIGYAMLKDTATLISLLNLPSSKVIFPARIKFEFGEVINDNVYPVFAKKTALNDYSNISSKMFEKVSIGKSENSDGFEINISLKPEFNKIFSTLTKNNIQKGLIMSLDNIVLSAPIVQSEITAGKFIINSNFSKEEAQVIATCLKTGILLNKPIVQDFGFIKNN